MRRHTLFATFIFLALLSLNFHQVVSGQKSKQTGFYIESQPDSPILIRDLTATILPVTKNRTASGFTPPEDKQPSPEARVTFFIENRSGKKITGYNLVAFAEDGADSDNGPTAGSFGGVLLPGEIRLFKMNSTLGGKSVIYRVRSVSFEGGTNWNAKPFNAGKVKKSALVKAVPMNNAGRILPREWSVPLFNDRLVNSVNGADVIIEGIKIQTKLHKIKTERLDMLESCNLQNDELEKAYNEQDYDVESFTSYEFKGKIFAYTVSYEAIDAEGQYEIGVGFQNIYIDETGDGIFKLKCDETEVESVPQWVKALAAQ